MAGRIADDYPTPTKLKGCGHYQQTGTTTTGKRATMGDNALTWLSAIAILFYAMTGVLMGLVILWGLSFPLQLAAMAAYLVLGFMGWLPWQIAKGE